MLGLDSASALNDTGSREHHGEICMPFPETDRVIYAHNPLEQVICQFRFPPILRIDSELPAQFQDRIRHEFPSLIEKSGLKLELQAFSPDDGVDFTEFSCRI